MKTYSRHAWTKEEVRAVLSLWSSKNSQEIAEKLKVRVPQVHYIAKAIRTERPELLPKKRLLGSTRTLVRDVLAELDA